MRNREASGCGAWLSPGLTGTVSNKDRLDSRGRMTGSPSASLEGSPVSRPVGNSEM